MRIRSLIAVLATAMAAVMGASSGAVASPVAPLIIGGGTVSSAPWAAAVFSNGSFTCSGTIIAPQWVLTARHCLGGSMSVRVGSVYRSSGGVTRTVSATYGRYDLALMRLSSSVSTSYVTLASSNPPVNSTNSIYGWGMTCYSGCSASSQLKTASVRVTSTNVSDAYGGQAIRSTRINGNAWRGDSGGPQFYNGQQVGVASTADGQSIQNYGSVAYNRAWIRSVSGV
ncbi:S1 family peptidase [Verrucosispora sp. WMMD703]|uniref:Serine protease n=2 Tax=Micromonospora TaxID=1873 RepID=A0A9W5UT01_9ACTN|nr:MULTISPECIES: trypsin-like serine protease [Micromonospora]NEE63673.1 trypsin-like serine protease [Verrucosispora sioxanthis]NGM12783.1 trypsin-like serine protease [Verrucosispora sioxanthis]WBB48152.1 trypsin-like serine protease [Verrucosispora sp. WMMA2044]SFC75939.1 Trypsin [Micromonospora sediminimaris]GIJ33999.1 serine protease [Micromonospora sediminimaris]